MIKNKITRKLLVKILQQYILVPAPNPTWSDYTFPRA